eukprot:CAMPEP_0182418280 /NCGR_PEP_ID=MMETSP1167-20130531/2755_1 /TAXON_ID=2988 /ORGANISM="Mallomonas Sp, Strain CCMP3275" /LENGTH=286 /DNA_ID=CAMNT_0024592423 /DNA_START=46 /DNA_END=906 /DNA_ORIENTATION=+
MSAGCCCCQCVKEMNAGVVENCGKYSKVGTAGFFCIMYPCENITGIVSMKIQQLDVSCDTKTKDNVFVKVVVSVQYRVVESKVPSAYYKLTDHRAQITSYVFDVIRSAVPRLELDEAFASKESVAETVKSQLSNQMSEYGYEILVALVTDLNPDQAVKNAMNEINAASRLREAAKEKAEAEKILLVKAAEADADSKYLSGLGVARQRKAIVDGLKSTVNEFSEQVPGASASDVMDLLLLTQYFDMMKDVGGKGKSNGSIFLPHGPQAINDLRQQLKHSFKNMSDNA